MSYESECVIRAQKRKKQFAIDQFGGKCIICGYDRCINALEFHHTDGKDKSPSYVIGRWSWNRARKELDKCILVCANCHREIHYEKKDISLIKKEIIWIKIECAYCHNIFETRNNNQIYCSNACRGDNTRRVVRPKKEELKNEIDSGISFLALGRKYGVSDNAIRKWAKSYGIM